MLTKSLMFLRGEQPMIDDLYDTLHHPNIQHSSAGGAPEYLYARDLERPRFRPEHPEDYCLMCSEEIAELSMKLRI